MAKIASGTVYWHGIGKERVPNVIVKAILTKQNQTSLIELAPTDDDGDFAFNLPEPGKWQFIAIHEQGFASKPQEHSVEENQSAEGIEFRLFPYMGQEDRRAGNIFFASVCGGFLLLIIIYLLLHRSFPPLPQPIDETLLNLITEIEGQDSRDEEELQTFVNVILERLDILSNRNGLSEADRETISRLSSAISEIDNDPSALLLHIEELKKVLMNLTLAPSLFWNQGLWRLFEVLFWALAGILANKIIVTGTYLRWNRFYAEGIFMHLAHILTVPLLVIVATLLLSLATFEITLATDNSVQLDLSKPEMLIALSFLLGARPWSVWQMIQSTADRVTGQ